MSHAEDWYTVNVQIDVSVKRIARNLLIFQNIRKQSVSIIIGNVIKVTRRSMLQELKARNITNYVAIYPAVLGCVLEAMKTVFLGC
jgi:enolase